MARPKRKDKTRVVLKTGEGQRTNGTYFFRWTDKRGERHSVYAKTLDELRYKEEQIEKDKKDGIKAEARFTTVNDLFEDVYKRQVFSVLSVYLTGVVAIGTFWGLLFRS